MVSRNVFFGAFALATLIATSLTGCAPTAPETQDYSALTRPAASTEAPTPIELMASTGGEGTAVAFPATTPPSFKEPVDGADHFKVYGNVRHRVSGDLAKVPTNIAEEVDVPKMLEEGEPK